MHSLSKTELVDPNLMTGAEDVGRKEALLDNLASLLALTHETCSPEQMEIYDNILINLIELVAVEARIRLAEVLAPLQNAPASTIRCLASDNIAVARLILEQSPVLDDIDLQYICQNFSDDHMLAITQRTTLSEAVSDAIVVKAGKVVLRSLTKNSGALISDFGFRNLVEKAEGDEDLQEALAHRHDIPASFIQKLARVACDRVKAQIENMQVPELEESLRFANIVVLSNLHQGAAMTNYDFEAAREEVAAKIADGALSTDDLQRYAEEDQFAHCVYTHAYLAGISELGAMTELTWSKPTMFMMTARALDYPETLTTAVMHCGPWKSMLDEMARTAGRTQYHRIRSTFAVRHLEDQRNRYPV